VELLEVSIRDYGPYWWYDPLKERMPKNFSLVVCDGPGPPPRGSGLSGTGRYSLLRVMRSHLVPDCTVLLDDIDKDTGAVTLSRWAEEFGVSYRVEGVERPFAVIVVRATDARRGG